MLGSYRLLLAATLIAFFWSSPLSGQYEYDENSKINTNLGFPVTVPAGNTSEFVTLGTGITAGVGYNFNRYNAFVGEFMWNWLYPTDASLTPLRTALQTSDLNGHSNFYALTANYRLEVRGNRFGAYLIGGAGVYYRNASLSKTVTPPAGTICTPVWIWWGFSCSSGTVIVAQTHTSFTSGVFGGNAGVGVTIKVGEPRYRLYFEARYHYAPSSTFTTRLIPITTGIRF